MNVCPPIIHLSVPSVRYPDPAPADGWNEIDDLCTLCREGKLYEVEQWIADGKPIQCKIPSDPKLRKRLSPLQIVAASGFHSLAELLLVNGYNPNGDYGECLSEATRERNHSMVELLLRYGADPCSVDFETVLETYDRAMMDLFIGSNVDPCADHSVARVLRHKKSPHLGFVKTYCERFPGLLRQATIALRSFVEEGDLKGVSLMLWLGADPYEDVPEADWDDVSDDDYQQCALVTAASRSNSKVIQLLFKVPVPETKVQKLYRDTAHWANPHIVKKLLAIGASPNDFEDGIHVLESMICHATSRLGRTIYPGLEEHGVEAVRLASQAGARLEFAKKELASLRRRLIDGESRVVCSIIEILRQHHVLDDSQLYELTRTPAMKQILSGYSKPYRDPLEAYRPRVVVPVDASPAKTSYWKRRWWQQ